MSKRTGHAWRDKWLPIRGDVFSGQTALRDVMIKHGWLFGDFRASRQAQFYDNYGHHVFINFVTELTTNRIKIGSIQKFYRSNIADNPGTPKKGKSTRMFQGRKYYYVGRTLYFNKMLQIKDKVREMGAGVAVTKSKGKGFMIWSTQKVHIPLMEVGGSDLFMEGEYNPRRKVRK